MRERENGGGLGRDDRVALADRLGESGNVLGGDVARRLERAGRDHRHAGLHLILADKHGDAVVPHHGHQRFAQLRVEMVGVRVDEVHDFLGRGPRRMMQPAHGGVLQKAAAGQPRQLAALRDAGHFLQQPADLRMSECPIRDAGQPAGERGQRVDPRQQPVVQREAVGAHVRGLGFEHQLGNIDVGRAFEPAHVAMDAQVGHLLADILQQRVARQIAGEQAAHEIRLRPRRGFFARIHAEDRAHAHVGRRRSTNSAAVAGAGGRLRFPRASTTVPTRTIAAVGRFLSAPELHR